MDQIVNQAAKIHFMVGGQADVPLVIRAPGGSGTGAAAQHSQSLEAWFAHIPGLKVVMPSNATDAGRCCWPRSKTRIRCSSWSTSCSTSRASRCRPSSRPHVWAEGRIEREGTDLTIVATAIEVQRAVEAAQQLAEKGIRAEVIDPRTHQAPRHRSRS